MLGALGEASSIHTAALWAAPLCSPSSAHSAALKLSSLSRTKSPCRCHVRGTSHSSSSDQLSPRSTSSRRSSQRSFWAGGCTLAAFEGTGSCGRDAVSEATSLNPCLGGNAGSRPPGSRAAGRTAPAARCPAATAPLPSPPAPAGPRCLLAPSAAGTGHPRAGPLPNAACKAGAASRTPSPLQPPKSRCGQSTAWGTAGPPGSLPAHLRCWAKRGSVASAGMVPPPAAIVEDEGTRTADRNVAPACGMWGRIRGGSSEGRGGGSEVENATGWGAPMDVGTQEWEAPPHAPQPCRTGLRFPPERFPVALRRRHVGCGRK